jgi:hypothetical protein
LLSPALLQLSLLSSVLLHESPLLSPVLLQLSLLLSVLSHESPLPSSQESPSSEAAAHVEQPSAATPQESPDDGGDDAVGVVGGGW